METATAPKSAGKILVIDDNLIIQRAVHFALRDQGYQVLAASDISEGINIIRQGSPDLILLDLSFPLDTASIGNLHQDGFYFIDWLGRTPGIAQPPVIIISSTDPASYREPAAAAGVKACLQKPLNKETLLAAIRSVLGDPGPAKPPGGR